MKLYLLTQNENSGYDTYDSCVVADENEEQARMIRPSYPEWDEFIGNDWASSPENVNVTLLGVAVDGTEPGVICASFNAG
jgi:hypothetical protein